MADLPPDEPQTEAERKKEIAAELRALAKSPGWQYLCRVLAHQKATILANMAEADSLDALLRLNSEMREVKTYDYLIGLPLSIVLEFDPTEASND